MSIYKIVQLFEESMHPSFYCSMLGILGQSTESRLFLGCSGLSVINQQRNGGANERIKKNSSQYEKKHRFLCELEH